MNDNCEVPKEIQEAALKVENWFIARGIKEWCLFGIQSRPTVEIGLLASMPSNPIIFLRTEICPLCGARSTSADLPCSDCQWKSEKPTDCTCPSRTNPSIMCPIHSSRTPGMMYPDSEKERE